MDRAESNSNAARRWMAGGAGARRRFPSAVLAGAAWVAVFLPQPVLLPAQTVSPQQAPQAYVSTAEKRGDRVYIFSNPGTHKIGERLNSKFREAFGGASVGMRIPGCEHGCYRNLLAVMRREDAARVVVLSALLGKLTGSPIGFKRRDFDLILFATSRFTLPLVSRCCFLSREETADFNNTGFAAQAAGFDLAQQIESESVFLGSAAPTNQNLRLCK